MHTDPSDRLAAAVHAVLERPEVIDPLALERAARPGRVRGIATEAWRRAVASPMAADGILRRALRDARALHSRERRLVADALYDLAAVRPLLVGVLGTDDADALWLGWLVHRGLDPALALAELPDLNVAACGDLPKAVLASLAGLDADDALGRVAGVDGPLAAQVGAALAGWLDDVPAFLGALVGRAPAALRVNRRWGSRDALLAGLQEEGIEAVAGRWSPDAVIVPAGTNLLAHKAFQQGVFELQDEASQLVAALVRPSPGLRVLDACAGAGGKTLALASMAGGRMDLHATDVRKVALDELARRAEKAGARVSITQLFEEGPAPKLGAPFDAVLVDAPCTGSGVWRRHPTWRWRLEQPGELGALTALHDRVLDDAVGRVRSGGRLVVATCSFLPVEDEARIEALLARHPQFQVVPVTEVLPWLHPSLADGPFLRARPHVHDTDAFFAAVLQRR